MRIVPLFVCILLRWILKLRYRIKMSGTPYRPSKKGTLILANHPALIDPIMMTAYLWPSARFHAVAADFLAYNKWTRWGLRLFGTLYVPVFDYSSNSYKQYRIDQAYQQIVKLLQAGESVLIYPSGGLKDTGLEKIGGASGLHHILQKVPEVSVYFVRIEGLWGSQFSRALTGKVPEIFSSFFRGFKWVIKNGLFFTPKRKVWIESCYAPLDFPRYGSKREINTYLEGWFNHKGAEPLTFVSYSCFSVVLPKVLPKAISPSVSVENIPESIREMVLGELGQLANKDPNELTIEQDLSLDLGLDSLDRSQIALFLKECFGVFNVQVTQLTTVGTVLAFAAKQIKVEDREEEELELKTPQWDHVVGRPPIEYPRSETLIGGFLYTCDRMGEWVAAVDQSLGEISYRRMKMAVILFARYLKTIPEERIGILLPASIAANIAVLATQLAGKVPVMINWTLGERNIQSVVAQTGLRTTISSWKVLDQLDNVNLSGLDEYIVTLEEIKQGLSLKDKISSWFLSRLGTHFLRKKYGIDRLTGHETAVILFTSGTENMPKGVPLSHRNVMENQKAALSLFPIQSDDALLSFLPPFHSFGFSVTGLFPLLIGWRVGYMPNPTQSRRLIGAIKRWQITTMCVVPTFLRMILRNGSKEAFQSLRLVISGAENCPQPLLESLGNIMPQTQFLEGYGITECSPILTLTRLGEVSQGVGKPLPGVDLCIVDPDTHITKEKGETGLILAAGPNVFSGYLHGVKQSPFLNISGQKWYNTGDLGYINPDGQLVLEGRLKRFVKIGGEMVSLGQIEHILNEAAPKEAWTICQDTPSLAICAIEDPEEKTQLHLFTTFPVQKNRVNELLKEGGMSNLVRITAVHTVAHIPVLGSGKINYRQLHVPNNG